MSTKQVEISGWFTIYATKMWVIACEQTSWAFTCAKTDKSSSFNKKKVTQYYGNGPDIYLSVATTIQCNPAQSMLYIILSIL